jgi:hypothetical protein
VITVTCIVLAFFATAGLIEAWTTDDPEDPSGSTRRALRGMIPRMKFSLLHVVAAIIAILASAAPTVTAQFPAMAPVDNLIIQLSPGILVLLGYGTASVVSSVNASAALKATAARVASALLFVPLLLVCGVACHETPQAAVAQTVDITDDICALAPDSPVDGPLVEVICVATEGLEGVATVIVGAIADGGPLAAATVATVREDCRVYHFPLPRAAAPAFLAAHHGAMPPVTPVAPAPAPAPSAAPAAPPSASAAPSAASAAKKVSK